MNYEGLLTTIESLTNYLEAMEMAAEHALTDRVVERYMFICLQIRLVLATLEPIRDRAQDLNMSGDDIVMKPVDILDIQA